MLCYCSFKPAGRIKDAWIQFCIMFKYIARLKDLQGYFTRLWGNGALRGTKMWVKAHNPLVEIVAHTGVLTPWRMWWGTGRGMAMLGIRRKADVCVLWSVFLSEMIREVSTEPYVLGSTVEEGGRGQKLFIFGNCHCKWHLSLGLTPNVLFEHCFFVKMNFPVT